jgi:hypothetical protein
MKKENYSLWSAMIQRCTNPKRNCWKHYGGRGIKVCERWRNFENFISDMGPRPPGTTLDRINPDGNYEPSNCRWATHKEQTLTKRVKPILKCSNCGDDTTESSGYRRSWHGLCHKCNEYKRRNGYDRPKDESELKRLQAEKIAGSCKKGIYAICIKTGEKIYFDKVTDAIKVYGSGVSHCLARRVKTIKGYVWKYQNNKSDI